MSMAYPQHQQQANNKTIVILITLGVILASIVELVVVAGAYIYIIGSIFANQFNKLDQLQKAEAAARENTRQVASRPNGMPSWNTPSSSRTPSFKPTPSDGPGTSYTNIAMVGVNDRVYIQWGSSWWPGTVIERRGTVARIHYDNHANSWDEDVGLERLRKMPLSDPNYRDRSQVASGSPSVSRPRTNLPSGSPPTTSGGPTTFSSSPSGASNTADLNPRNLSAPYNSRHQPQDTLVRDWRNRSGDVVFRGQLYANFGPAVRLVLRDGFTLRSIPVDASLLSDEDQAYVKRFPEVSPDRPDPGDDERTKQMQQQREEMEKRMQELRDRARQRAGNSSLPPGIPVPSAPTLPDIKGMRKWSDSSGKFTLDAELIGVESGNVKLQRPDGKIVTMPIDKLSADDRDAVRAKYPGQ